MQFKKDRTHRLTDRQTDKQTDTQTHRHTEPINGSKFHHLS